MSRQIKKKAKSKAKSVKQTPKKISKAKASSTIRYSFFVRHGERNDHKLHMVGKIDMSKNDPVLTPLGMKQARESGKFLKALLKQIEQKEGRKFDNVVIQSSPFMRARQTAAKISKAIGKDRVLVNYQLAEMMHGRMFPASPIPLLKSYDKKKAELDSKFSLEGIDFMKTQLDEKTVKFPETFPVLNRRTKDLILGEKRSFRQARGQMTACIGVSHGVLLHQIPHFCKSTGRHLRTYKQCNQSFRSKAWVKKECNYCCISAMKLFRKEPAGAVQTKMILNASDKHVISKA